MIRPPTPACGQAESVIQREDAMMKPKNVGVMSVLFVVAVASTASAQLTAAKEGPVVYGHHHVNAKRLEAMGIKLERPYTKVPALNIGIAFIRDPWGTYIELTEGLDKAS
jgi:hypothetical protein